MTDDRGVSTVMGFIIIFGFLVITFTLYQGIAVPDQNRGVEFNHNQKLQGELQELRNALLTTASTGSPQAVDISLAARYPDRVLARNLGATSGSILDVPTDGPDEIRIENATAQDGHGEVEDQWDGTVQSFGTTAIVYQPVYSFYTNAPATYLDNALVANRFADVNLTVTDQAIVNDERITLISVVGDLSRSGDRTETVQLEAVSTATNTVSVRNESHNVTITIPTHLPADTWNETLWGEHVDNPDADGHVLDVRDGGPGEVDVVLEPGVTYELRLARVSIGGNAGSEPATYLALADRPDRTIGTNTSHFVTVEARDQFNNPVTGASVTATIEGDGTFADGTDERTLNTGGEGEARVEYTAPDETGDEAIVFTINDGGAAAERVRVNVSVVTGAGSGGEGTSEINPSGAGRGTLVFVNASDVSGDEISLFLNNTANEDITISRVRFQFYSPGSPSDQAEPPERLTFAESDPVPYLGDFKDVGNVTLPASQISPITVAFEGGNKVPGTGDFFIITIETDAGDRITYFMGVT